MGKSEKKSIVYLDTACMGMVSKAALNEIRTLLSDLENISSPSTQVTLELYSYMPKAREAVANLFRASPEEIALVESTSHGLGLIANSIPLEKENNVLICDLEFMASTICLKARQEKVGFEIREVSTKNGEIKISDYGAAIDDRTRVIVVSSVQEANGFRVDIKELSRLAKKYGCYLIVDGIQEAGVLEVNLSDWDVSAYCSGGHKWLRNPFGTGFLYVNKKILKDIKPSFYGYFNSLEPEEGWISYVKSPERTPFDHLEMTETAQKFETGGTGNYLGALGLYKNVTSIKEYGITNIEKKVKELNDHLIKGLKDLNLKIVSSSTPLNRSGITCFSLPGGLEKDRLLATELEKQKIFISVRYTSGIGGVRVSPHHHNSLDDVNRFLEITKNCLNKKSQ